MRGFNFYSTCKQFPYT